MVLLIMIRTFLVAFLYPDQVEIAMQTVGRWTTFNDTLPKKMSCTIIIVFPQITSAP